MQFDGPSICIDTDKIPKNGHTIINFDLPFAIPIPDGLYEIKLGDKKADIVLKRVAKPDFGWHATTGSTVQLNYDKYGRSAFSRVSMTLKWIVDFTETGRTPAILKDVGPRKKIKEIAIRYLNRLIEVVRQVTEEFWVGQVRYQDILSYELSYWDGKRIIQAETSMLDSGLGGIKAINGNPFVINQSILDKLNDALVTETQIDSSSALILNAKNACLEESFRLAIVEAVAALEVVLYKFIKIQGKRLNISNEDLDGFIIKVGLSGNIKIVLLMLTKGLEQVNSKVLSECMGAIKIRNKIMHEGLLDVGSTDAEKRVIAIEKMIVYLKRITV